MPEEGRYGEETASRPSSVGPSPWRSRKGDARDGCEAYAGAAFFLMTIISRIWEQTTLSGQTSQEIPLSHS